MNNQILKNPWITPRWHPQSQWTHTLSAAWQRWLLHPHSFIAHLKKVCLQPVSVRVLNQEWAIPDMDEKKMLSISERKVALIREVLIITDQPWMFARCVIPKPTLTGKERGLMHLKNRSLGSFIFKYPHLERSPFEIASLSPHMRLHAKTSHAAMQDLPELYARRSLFKLNEKPLLLTEVFFPAIETL